MPSVSVDPGYVQALQEKALQLDLDRSRLWRLLGHYNKKLYGWRSEVDGHETFFLSPRGHRDPRAELLATIEAFFEPIPPEAWSEPDPFADSGADEPKTSVSEEKVRPPGDSHPQCRFLARRDWLFKELNVDTKRLPKHPCAYYTGWKRKLDAEGVSLVFASAYLGNAASMFGHTFMKFHSRGNNEDRDLLNYGVNFAATTGSDGGMAFALHGLTGGYKGQYSLLPYHQTLKTYTNLEGRDIWEYRLNLTSEEIDFMVSHLLELQGTWFDYYFFDENCSYQLLWLIELVRPEIRLIEKFNLVVIPADTIRHTVRSANLVKDIRFRPALQSQFHALTPELNSKERRWVRKLIEDDESEFATTTARLASETKARQALILDSALLYASIRMSKEPELQTRNHKLKIQRAQLGLASDGLAWKKAEATATRPEEGHDPARVLIGAGDRNGRSYQELSMRMAYHNLLSADAGYLPNTQMETGRISLRRYEDPESLQLREFMFVDLLSATPRDSFFAPLTWGVNFGLHRPPDLPPATSLVGTVNGGIGRTFGFFQNRLTAIQMLQGHLEGGSALERNHRLGASVSSQLVAHLHSRLRLGGGVAWHDWFAGDTKHYSRAWAQSSFTLTRNLELRLDYNRTDDQKDWAGSALWHFMF